MNNLNVGNPSTNKKLLESLAVSRNVQFHLTIWNPDLSLGRIPPKTVQRSPGFLTNRKERNLVDFSPRVCLSFTHLLTLVMMGGGLMCPPQSVFIFSLKISPPDQTLRPTCKFLILGILYHDFFFLKI